GQGPPAGGGRHREPGLRALAGGRMTVDVRIPSLGESVTEGVIVRWARQDGDTVRTDEVLLELETDKASMEIPAPESGVLHIVKPQGDKVAVGDVVARIDQDGAPREAAPTPAPAPAARAPVQPPPARPNLEAASEQDPIGHM